ncbi:MAG: hypothetical protein JW981_06965, partial [Anaerolineae bacterium]|nr:hypothetical protein [Anaerolineae bacterium]
MTIPGPLLILGIPATVAVILQLLRRWTVLSAWLSALTAASLGFMIAFFPLSGVVSLGSFNIEMGSPFIILGRVLLIEAVDQLPLGFLFFTAASLFILAWRLLPHSNFFPIGLGMTTLLAGVLIVEQVVFAALLVEMAAILAVFPLHEPGEAGSHIQRTGSHALGGLRYMAYASLALPGLMVTQLLLDMFAIFPNDTGLLNTAAALLIVSFAILLGAVPFQSWLSMVAVDGSPPVVTFLFTANIGVVWFMLLAYLESYAWLGKLSIIGPLFTVVGLLMMVMGALLAASHRRLGRLVAYATLVDNGA